MKFNPLSPNSDEGENSFYIITIIMYLFKHSSEENKGSDI